MKQLLLIGNLSSMEWVVLLLLLFLFMGVPLLLGYFIGVSKGRRDNMQGIQ
jgi:hypothetical protein